MASAQKKVEDEKKLRAAAEGVLKIAKDARLAAEADTKRAQDILAGEEGAALTKEEKEKKAAADAKAKAELEAKQAAEAKALAAAQAAKPKAGAVGHRCEKNGAARGACNTGLCCGAARKIITPKTDTAVAVLGGPQIESCQLSTATAYKHQPLAVDGKTQEQEVWNFTCITGAYKLAASAGTGLIWMAYMLA